MAKIRIIDDDVELAQDLASVLRNQSHDVTVGEETEGALQALINDPPDLLILDVMFPENPAGGFDLAREIRKNGKIKDLPVILLTAINRELPMDFSARDIDEDWMPVEDFVEKPINIASLLEKVDNFLGKARE